MARLTVLFLIAISFAGCIEYAEDVGPGTFQLSADIPTVVTGDTAAFTLAIAGAADVASDHIGAHYWATPQSDPTGTIGVSEGCAHSTADDVAGETAVTCTFPAPGTYYVRGHMRYTGEETYNYWSEEVEVQVVELVMAADAEGDATAGEDYMFTLQVTGSGSASSDHIGAHYWLTAQDDPTATFAEQAGGCVHTVGDVPGTYQITCNWSDAGTYHVYGHLRLNDGREDINLWTDGFTVAVA